MKGSLSKIHNCFSRVIGSLRAFDEAPPLSIERKRSFTPTNQATSLPLKSILSKVEKTQPKRSVQWAEGIDSQEISVTLTEKENGIGVHICDRIDRPLPLVFWKFKEKIINLKVSYQFTIRRLGPDKNISLHLVYRDPRFSLSLTDDLSSREEEDIFREREGVYTYLLKPTFESHLTVDLHAKYKPLLDKAVFTTIPSMSAEEEENSPNTECFFLLVFYLQKAIENIPAKTPFVIKNNQFIAIHDAPMEEEQLYKSTWYEVIGENNWKLHGVQPLDPFESDLSSSESADSFAFLHGDLNPLEES